jgi:hypothetical protein
VLSGFWLREAWLLTTELPEPLPALAQIVGAQQLIAACREEKLA